MTDRDPDGGGLPGAYDPRGDYDDDQGVGAAIRHKVWGPALALVVIGGWGRRRLGWRFRHGRARGLVPVRSSDAGMMAGFLAVFGRRCRLVGGHRDRRRRMIQCRNRDLAVTGAAFCILTAPMYLVSPVVVPMGVWASTF